MLMCLFLPKRRTEVRRRQIEAASVIDIGQNRFIHVEVSSDRDCAGHLRFAEQNPGLAIGGSNACDQSVGGVSDGVGLTFELEVDDDRLVENNSWLARIERVGRATGIAVETAEHGLRLRASPSRKLKLKR